MNKTPILDDEALREKLKSLKRPDKFDVDIIEARTDDLMSLISQCQLDVLERVEREVIGEDEDITSANQKYQTSRKKCDSGCINPHDTAHTHHRNMHRKEQRKALETIKQEIET